MIFEQRFHVNLSGSFVRFGEKAETWVNIQSIKIFSLRKANPENKHIFRLICRFFQDKWGTFNLISLRHYFLIIRVERIFHVSYSENKIFNALSGLKNASIILFIWNIYFLSFPSFFYLKWHALLNINHNEEEMSSKYENNMLIFSFFISNLRVCKICILKKSYVVEM